MSSMVNFYEKTAALTADLPLIGQIQSLLPAKDFEAFLAALVTTGVLFLIGFGYSAHVKSLNENAEPKEGLNAFEAVDGLLEFVKGFTQDLLGAELPRFFPLLCSLFLFIFVSNLSGLLPGLPPATDNLSTNLTLALLVFIVYHIAGVKEHGLAYLKQFTGPLMAMAPLLIVIESIGHLARPVSLSLRLYANIFGDHLVLEVFTQIFKIIVPVIPLMFGLLVASLQSFVFTLLSTIYIAMATSHDH